MPLAGIQPLSFDQNNPILAGMSAGEDLIGKGIQNYYNPQLDKQNVQAKVIANQASQAALPYAGPQAAATLQQLIAKAALENAAARQTNFQTSNPAYMPGGVDASAFSGYRPNGINGAQTPQQPNQQPMQQQPQQMQQPQNAASNTGNTGNPSNGIPAGGQNDQQIGTTMFNPNGGSQAYRIAIGAGSNGQQSPQQPNQQPNQNAKPDYAYGVKVPDITTKYSTDPLVNQVMLSRFPLNANDKFNFNVAQQQTHNAVEFYKDEQQRASQIADASYRANQNIDEIVNSYNKLGPFQRGWLGGHNPALSSEANQVDQGVAKLISDSAQIWQQGHLTNANLDLTAQQKLGRGLNPEAVSNIATGLKAYNNRAYEYQGFLNEANAQRIAPATTQLLWNRYNQLRPPFNSADNIANNSYKGTYQDFLTPQAVQNPSQYVPQNQGQLASNIMTAKDLEDTAKTHNQNVSTVRSNLRQRGII